MKEVFQVTKEIFTNLITIHRLAKNELLLKNKGNLMGMIWLWLNPMIQIMIYAMVFGEGIRGRKPVDGVPFFYWFIGGFVIWNFIQTTVNPASKSIIRKIRIITKIKFPVTIMPIVTVVSNLYVHLILLLTIMIILLLTGGFFSMYWLYTLYYMFAAVCLLSALSILNSAITTVFRDYQHIVYNVMRFLFYFTPILFPNDTITEGSAMSIGIRLNPFSYLVEGYRDSLVYGQRVVFLTTSWGVYFWTLVILIYIIGCFLTVRMRKNLLDYL